MSKPEKTGTDDLKRMLRRLERIEAEKAERADIRSTNGPVRTRDLSSAAAVRRRPDVSPADQLAELAQTPRRSLSSALQLAPEFPNAVTTTQPPPVQSRDERWDEQAESQRVGAPVVVTAVIAAFVSTLATVAITAWLMGGADRGPASNESKPQPVAARNAAAGAAAVGAAATTTPAAGSPITPQDTAPPPRFGDNRIAPEDAPPAAEAQPAGDDELAPPPAEKAEAVAPEKEEAPAETAAQSDTAPQAPESQSASSVPAKDEGPPVPLAALQTPEPQPQQPQAASPPPSAAPATDVTPPAPVAATQVPRATQPETFNAGSVSAGSLRLITAQSVAAEPGSPLVFPVSIEAPEANVRGYYLVVSGLKRGSKFSHGIELLYDTWQIPATALSGLQLTIPAGFARHMNLKLELRGPTGEAAKRSVLTIELPGEARKAVGLDTPEALGDQMPNEEAQELIDRAEVFLDNGSIQGARLLLERAANHGAGYAAMLLATSYDPRYAKHFSASRAEPDPAQARRWYERALELGVSLAQERL